MTTGKVPNFCHLVNTQKTNCLSLKIQTSLKEKKKSTILKTTFLCDYYMSSRISNFYLKDILMHTHFRTLITFTACRVTVGEEVIR